MDQLTTSPKNSQIRDLIEQDPSATLRRDQAEGDLIVLRWVLLALATLYLLFSGTAQYPLLGWIAIIGGVLANGVFVSQEQQRPFSFLFSLFAQGIDIAVLQLYTASLQGGMARYLALYTAILVVATIRFGIWGTVGSSVLGLLLSLITVVTSPSTGGLPTLAVIWGTILADAVLLGYFAYLFKNQHSIHQRAEALLQKKISEITVLHEVSSTAHDLKSEDALQSIVEIVTKVMGFQRSALFLTDNVEETIPHRYHSYRSSARSARLSPISMDPELFDDVLKRQDPLVIDGSQGSLEMGRGPALQIAVPLHGEQGPIGILVADCNDRRSASRSDMGMLSNLAKSAVVAIENASLHRRVRRMANHDGVTDLYNHRYFQERLREMLQVAEGNWPVSLLMVEIDKFKRYNDTFGHRQGDKALFGLSRALEESTQPWDGLVARYGGDEFVVILPQVGRQESAQITRAVRDLVYQLVSESLAKQNLPPVMLSIGVATYPEDAQNASDLVEAADQAMYVVKHSGGNRVHAYSESKMTLS